MLLDSDFSTCLSSLWKYELKNPDDPSDLIVRAIQVKKTFLEKLASGEPIEIELTIQDDKAALIKKVESQSVRGPRHAMKQPLDINASTTASASSKGSRQKPPIKK